MQIVGILGLISLITMNNAYWVAALLLAAMRIPDLVTPFKSISRSLKKLSVAQLQQVPEQVTGIPPVETLPPDPIVENPTDKEDTGDA